MSHNQGRPHWPPAFNPWSKVPIEIQRLAVRHPARLGTLPSGQRQATQSALDEYLPRSAPLLHQRTVPPFTSPGISAPQDAVRRPPLAHASQLKWSQQRPGTSPRDAGDALQARIGGAVIQRYPNPRGPTLNVTEAQFQGLINAGRIDMHALMGVVPAGVANTWTAGWTDRIWQGFKFEWQDVAGTWWHVHGHARDPQAPQGGHARAGWVVRIKHGSKWLLQAPYNPDPTDTRPGHGPVSWHKAPRTQPAVENLTHIPLSNPPWQWLYPNSWYLNPLTWRSWWPRDLARAAIFG
jgi:hypothetical protein